ncbi:MAG TPA: hypothetical protein VN822_06240 [Candidatus Acidoferrales bacterium]|nr:hypothetical protein [Candidatus Acidoferrales bacterium]
MKDGFDFDGALKDVFQQDRPTLLTLLTRGLAVKEFLNVELPKVQERRVDLVLSLEDGSILHIEFQSTNDRNMAYRMVEYWPLIKRRFKRPLRQVVLYVGQARPAIVNRLEEDDLQFSYGVMDIREIEAELLMKSGNHGDLALAVLAGGGDARLRDILHQAAAVKGSRRDQLLAKILVLSGLRGIAGKVEWELKRMGVVIDVTKNPVLMRWRREALAEGEALGEARGMSKVLHEQLETKFGPLPKWAADRMAKASPAQVERWAKKVLTAGTLEAVLGKK